MKTARQIKKAIESKERKVAKYLVRLAILQDSQDKIDRRLCAVKVKLFELKEEEKRLASA